MAWAPDSPDSRAPDSWLTGAWAPDSRGGRLSLGRGVELFLAAKAAEGASPKTLEWYRMVLGRAMRDLGAEPPVDSLAPTELRAWLVTLREHLSPTSVAGYVRGIKAFGNWCALEELAEAAADAASGAPGLHRACQNSINSRLGGLADVLPLGRGPAGRPRRRHRVA